MIKKIVIGLLSVMLTTTVQAEGYESVAQPEVTYEKIKPEWHHRKGMRFGYSYINKGTDSGKLKNPSMFTMGFEAQQTMKGGEWLDILFIQNVTVGGLEQSLLIPSVNGLVGFEVNQRLQVGVGINATLADPSGEDNYLHLVTAAGWTQPAGFFSVPVHVVFIPDVNDYWRLAATTGVNW
jgi:hypothetical protein